MLANARRSPKYCKCLLAIKNKDQVLIPVHKELLCMSYLNNLWKKQEKLNFASSVKIVL